MRFGVTGVAELHGGRSWLQAAGAVGLVLAVVSLYAALALELEDSSSLTVLPVGRRGPSRRAVEGRWPEPLGDVATEPGVRRQL